MKAPLKISFKNHFKSRKSNHKHKKKGKGRAPCQGWTGDEERPLAQSWLDVSEDRIHDDDQDSKTYKEKVWRNYCKCMKKNTRNPKSFYSKWRTTNRATMEFNGIYMNAIENLHSGATELDVMAKVRKICKAKVGKAFANESFGKL
ncbi:unnamed protein product [Lactuca saligna]|uniref:Myb-like domain-containing protein n=1 Tax=Lactuca saligna TaxID=75948 RepID=A0AA35ZH52_LACSI|nr:unnamed protein product [Lactuca saligna]